MRTYKDWTPEEKERARLRARQRHEVNNAVWTQLHKDFPEKFPHAPPETYLGVRKSSHAHIILKNLQDDGPQTAKELGGGVRFENQTISAQIVRLLDADLIEHNNITKKYNVTTLGSEVLTHLEH